jgi:hypothetical protein
LASTVTWSDVTGNYPGGYVSDIAADPNNPNRVFATRGGFGLSRLYRSTTGGTTWTAVGGGLPNVPANSVALDRLEPARVFAGTDVGIYESTDGGDTFVPFSAGLPLGLVVTDLEIDDNPHVIVAATYGRGAFRVSLSTDNTPTDCGPETFTGTLSGTGAQQIQPNGSWYQSTVAGTHIGCLSGPSGANFNLYFDRWNGSAWVQVAASEGSTSSEKITFSATSGFYRWRIRSASGSGTYTFLLKRP